MPSAPIVVLTSGRPLASASRTFRRVPPPERIGTSTARAPSNHGCISGTQPASVTESPASAATAPGTSRPTTCSRAAGTRARTRGQIVVSSQARASAFGG